ncbi:hydantoinase B/oxoprolinase family protein [Roseibium salinum]|nr:hydantoinase B/oxoprolinase family protein [Roseibium salinum]
MNPRTGQQYVYLETLGGGMGGRMTKDGKDGVQVHITNTSNLPVEAIEMEYPLRVEEYALVEDSGGAGTHRGGLGIRRTIRPIDHECEFNGVGERFRHAPWGILGGQPGRPGRFYLRDDQGRERPLPSKASGIRITPTTAAVIETPGGGRLRRTARARCAACRRRPEIGQILRRIHPQCLWKDNRVNPESSKRTLKKNKPERELK